MVAPLKHPKIYKPKIPFTKIRIPKIDPGVVCELAGRMGEARQPSSPQGLVPSSGDAEFCSLLTDTLFM